MSHHPLILRSQYDDMGLICAVSVVLSPIIKILVAGSDTLVHVIDPVSGIRERSITTGHTHRIRALLSFIDNNTKSVQIITGSLDGTIRVIQLNDGKCIHVLKGHIGAVGAVVAMPLLKYPLIFSSGCDFTVRCWGMNDANMLQAYYHNDFVLTVIDFTYKSTNYIASGSDDQTIIIMEIIEPNNQIDKIPKLALRFHLVGHRGSIMALAVNLRSCLGPVLISGGIDKDILIWSLVNGEKLGQFPSNHTVIRSFQIIHCENLNIFSHASILITSGDGGIIRLWKFENGTKLAELTEPFSVIRSATLLEPMNRLDPIRLITVGCHGSISIWNISCVINEVNWFRRKNFVIFLSAYGLLEKNCRATTTNISDIKISMSQHLLSSSRQRVLSCVELLKLVLSFI